VHQCYKRGYHCEICNPCHEFTHGKADFDPLQNTTILRWLCAVKQQGIRPPPLGFAAGLAEVEWFNIDIREFIIAADILFAAKLEDPAIAVSEKIPFAYPSPWILSCLQRDAEATYYCYDLLGFKQSGDDPSWFCGDEE